MKKRKNSKDTPVLTAPLKKRNGAASMGDEGKTPNTPAHTGTPPSPTKGSPSTKPRAEATSRTATTAAERPPAKRKKPSVPALPLASGPASPAAASDEVTPTKQAPASAKPYSTNTGSHAGSPQKVTASKTGRVSLGGAKSTAGGAGGDGKGKGISRPTIQPKPPQEVLDALSYVEQITNAILNRGAFQEIDPPPDSLLSSTATFELTRSTESEVFERNLAAVPLSLQASPPPQQPPTATAAAGSPEGTATSPLARQSTSTIAPITSPRVSGGLAAMALLRGMHTHCTKLLKWAAVIEGGSKNPSLPEMVEGEKLIQIHATELSTTISNLQKHLKTWNDRGVEEFMKKASTKQIFDESTRQVATVHTSTMAIIAVRRVVRDRDLSRARLIVLEYGPPLPPSTPGSSMSSRHRVPGTPNAGAYPRRVVATPAPRSESRLSADSSASGRATGPPGGVPSAAASSGKEKEGSSPQLPYARPPAPPLVLWLARTWLPAMELWSKHLDRVKTALNSSDTAAMQDALSKARSDVVTKASQLQEIVLPGESLAELVDKHIETPLTRKMEDVTLRENVLRDLQSAVDSADFQNLASCVRATEAVRDLGDEGQKLVAGAQAMLLNMQKVAKVTVQLTIAQRSGDMATLVRAITGANQLLYSLKLAPEMEQCKAAMDTGLRLLNQPISNTASAFSSVEPDQLIVEHLPGVSWAAELTALYYIVAKRMAQLIEQTAAKSSVSMQLAGIRGQIKRETSMVVGVEQEQPQFNAHQARLLLERCQAAGVTGPDVDELSTLVHSVSERQVKVHFSSNVKIVSLTKDEIRSFDRVVESIGLVFKIPREVLLRSRGGASSRSGGGRVGVVGGSGGGLDSRPPSLRIRYQDRDGDFITIDSQQDWEVMQRNRTVDYGAVALGGLPFDASMTVSGATGTIVGSSVASTSSGRLELYVDIPAMAAKQQQQHSPVQPTAPTAATPVAKASVPQRTKTQPTAKRGGPTKTVPQHAVVAHGTPRRTGTVQHHQPPTAPLTHEQPVVAPTVAPIVLHHVLEQQQQQQQPSTGRPPRTESLPVDGSEADHDGDESSSPPTARKSLSGSYRSLERSPSVPLTRPVGSWIAPTGDFELQTIGTVSTAPPPSELGTTVEPQQDQGQSHPAVSTPPPPSAPPVVSEEEREREERTRRRLELQSQLAELKRMHSDLAGRQKSSVRGLPKGERSEEEDDEEPRAAMPGAVPSPSAPSARTGKTPQAQQQKRTSVSGAAGSATTAVKVVQAPAAKAVAKAVVVKRPMVKRAPVAPLVGAPTRPVAGGPQDPGLGVVGHKANP